MESKVCSKCSIEKTFDHYHDNGKSRDGKRNECIECFEKVRLTRIEKNKLLDKTNIYKICNKCEIEKHSTEYYASPSGNQGLKGDCKKCCIKRANEIAESKKNEPDLKTCCRCNIEQPIEEFHKFKFNLDGRKGHCKTCDKKERDDFKNSRSYEGIETTHKTCSKCKQVKSITQFNFDIDGKDKLDTQCRECTNIIARNWRQNNKEKMNELKRSAYYRNKQLGKCRNCGNARLENSNQFCEPCWYKDVAGGRTGDRTRWEEIRNLAISQDFKCTYTGDHLTPSLNMSLDHKVAQKRGGSNEITNLHWIDLDVNIMKRAHSEEVFISLCKKIVNHTNK